MLGHPLFPWCLSVLKALVALRSVCGGSEGVAGALNGMLGTPRPLSRHSSSLQWLTLLSGDSKELEFMSLPHTPCSELGEWLICLSAA